MINNGRLDWMMHRKLSYISVKTLIKKNRLIPLLYSLGAGCL